MTTQVAADVQTLPDAFYEEPEPIEDGMQQEPTITLLLFVLRRWFRGRNVFVGAKGFIFWNRCDAKERISPDCMVTLDTDPDFIYEFPNYFLWEVNKPPDVVMEVASPSTASNDLGHKRDVYARLGAREYWKFDPTGGDLYGVALMGECLVDGEYVPYELNVEPDGSMWSRSEVLNLDFYWDGESFDIRDPLTGQTINPAVISELAEERAELERTRADSAEERAESAEELAELERTRANSAEELAKSEREARLKLEAKLRRLMEERRRDDDGEQPHS